MGKKLHTVYMAAAVFGILSTGCIKSSQECPDTGSNVIFEFKYDYNTENTDKFYSEVEHIILYIYNADGVLCRKAEKLCSVGEQGNTVTAILENGQYNVVALGNFNSGHYAITGTDSMGTFQTSLNYLDEDNTVISNDYGALFHGSIPFEVTGHNVVVPVSLVKNVNRVRFVIKGLTAEYSRSANDGLELRITGNNTVYDAANDIVSGPEVIYCADLSTDGDDIGATFQVMRLVEDDLDMAVRLYVKHLDTGNGYIFEKPLIPLILREAVSGGHYDGTEYLDRRDTFEIPIVIGTDVNGSLILGEWDLIDQPQELGKKR